MSEGTPPEALLQVLDFPWEVLEYLSWLRQRASTRTPSESYLFDESRLRFAVEEADLLVCAPQLQVELRSEQLFLTTPRAPQGVLVKGIHVSERASLGELISAFDGERTLGEVRSRAGSTRPVLEAFLTSGFGHFLFAPLAVASAEALISGIEITRFPGSPYEIDRAYWRNMGDVRSRVKALEPEVLADDEAFSRWLRQLHVLALMGKDLQSYYQPASPISSGRAAPGRLMHTGTHVLDTREGALIVSGPRVNAAQLGGARYHEALYGSVGEPEASSPRPFADATGLDWGRLVHGRATNDAGDGAWFCPPRPLSPAHFASLRARLRRALETLATREQTPCIQALAEFHQNFIRLHPFHCGNQCLAMNIVNGILGDLLGAGIPHLMLDHLALRLSSDSYARIFARSVHVYADPQPSPAARYLRLATSRAQAFELSHRLSATASIEQALELIRRHPGAAQQLLLADLPHS